MKEVSIIPGRVRLRNTNLYNNKKLSRYINVYIDNLYGVKYCSVNHMTSSILILYDTRKTDYKLIVQNIESALYSAIKNGTKELERYADYYKILEKRTKARNKIVIYGLIYVALKIKHSLFGKFFLSSNLTALQLASAVTIIGGYPLLKRLYKRYTRNIPTDSDILLSLTALSMTLMRESSKGVLVLMLKAVNDYVKVSADAEGHRLINQNLSKTSGMAWISTSENQEVLISINSLNLGDIVIVHQGETVPVEGVVTEGRAVINSLYYTGQPIVSHIEEGSKIYEGVSVLSGELKIRVERIPEINHKTDLSKENLCLHRRAARYQEFITPISFGAGAISYLLSGNILNALATLLVLTPSAAGTAVSTGLKSYVALLNKHRIFIKNPNKLETISKTEHIVFDKTGTLTYGRMSIEKVQTYDDSYTDTDLLRICAACEADNYHPISVTLLEEMKGQYDAGKVSSSVLLPSRGIVANYDNHSVIIGNKALMEENQIDISPAQTDYLDYEERLFTPVLISIDHKLSGMLVLQDVLRNDSAALIKKLKQRGYTDLSLLTGDTCAKATDLAHRLGIEKVYGDCNYQDKADIISELNMNKTIMMVGDGVNDVLAMNNSDISVSFVNSSCDRVKLHSDCIVLEDEMTKLPDLIYLSQKSSSLINQSISFAQIFNITLGVMSIFGRFDAFAAKSLNTVNSLLVLLINKRIEYLSPPRDKKIRC